MLTYLFVENRAFSIPSFGHYSYFLNRCKILCQVLKSLVCRVFTSLVQMPMSLCNHELSVICLRLASSSLVSLVSSSLVLALASSVDSPPSHRFDNRNFISCRYMPCIQVVFFKWAQMSHENIFFSHHS